MSASQRIRSVYGVGGPAVKVLEAPFLANGAPASDQTNFPLGALWIDQSTSPATIYQYVGGGTWQSGGNAHASTTEYGIVILNDSVTMAGATDDQVPTALAIKTYVDNTAIAGAPLASEGSPGIAELATQGETNTGIDDARIVTPLKLKTAIGNASYPASFTTLAASGAVTFSSTGAIAMTSDTASSLGVTGAGIDLTLSSAAGRVVMNGEEAAADALRLLSAAGGLDVDVALQMNLTSSQNAADAVRILASAGGIDVDAVGAAGEDISIVNTGGSVIISATESAADSIKVESTAGGIDILASGAAAGEDIDIVATGSSVNIRSTENVGDAVVIESTVGGIQILASGAAATEDIVITSTGSSIRLTATENVTDAINIEATVGGLNILASGASAGEDINITATGSSVNVTSTENAALAVYLHANGGVSETVKIHADQGTGAASIDILSDVGGVTMSGGLATADAINIVASNAGGGIDVDAGTAGIAIDTTGALSLDSAATSNFTVTGAGADLNLLSVGGSVLVDSTENAALAIRLHANGGISETISIHSDQGTGVGSVQLLSDVGGITLTATGLASADAINLEAVAGGIDVDAALQINVTSSQDAADAVRILASAGGIDIDAVGAAGEDISILNTGGSVYIGATESAADSVKIESTAGGIDIFASGAAAGEDIDIVATGSSINITATEAAANAIVLSASDAAGGIDISTGGGSVDISSAGFVTMVAGTSSSATASNTINANVFAATYTGFTTASAGTQTFTIVNSKISTTSQLLLTLCNEGVNDAQMTIQRVKRLAGSVEVYTKNNGAAALNGDVTITGWVLA